MPDAVVVNFFRRPGALSAFADRAREPGPAGGEALSAEDLERFRARQTLAHSCGLRTTILLSPAALLNAEAAALAREQHEAWGDELALFPALSPEDGKAAVRDAFERFRERFGFQPESVGLCRLDAGLLREIKAGCPSVKCVLALCREEGSGACCGGVRDVFRDGGPWAPWIPSKADPLAPAADEREDSGVVAIPCLSRDLPACPDGDGCVLILAGPDGENEPGREERTGERPGRSWEEGCACCGRLKADGKLLDLTLAEFADRYRTNKTYTTPECFFQQDGLPGSGGRRFWYCDPYLRACVSMDRGGAIVDLRPYAAKAERPAGIGASRLPDDGYPFLIRDLTLDDGFSDGAGEGTVRSAKLCRNGEEAELGLCRTEARFSREGEDRILTFDPMELVFSDGLRVRLETVVTFAEGSASIRYDRRILSLSDPAAALTLREYLSGCCGAAEQTGDNPLTLRIEAGEEDSVEIPCESRGREAALAGAEEISCTVPPIRTRISMLANGRNKVGFVREGSASGPAFTLGWERSLREGEVFTTWLNLERAD